MSTLFHPAKLLCIASLVITQWACVGFAQLPIVDTWRYTIEQPKEGWQEVGFDDQSWNEGFGGFGTPGTPGARVGTTWNTPSIWLRKQFNLDSVPAKVGLWIHHDEDAQVFINGQLVLSLDGYTNKYNLHELDEAARKTLKTGANVMAVRCNQTIGGQVIDVHLVDCENLPKLPRAKRNPKPFQSELITRWGQELTAENAWTEYPRPQLVRASWTNLNGMWDYAIADVDQKTAPEKWDGEILVPFSLESKLGGVGHLLEDDESLWYHRSFSFRRAPGKRTLLHFEAVDYRCEVFLNGKEIGTHQGGNTPFSFDATDALIDGENSLVVRVEDETEGFQLNGKQRLSPAGIFYTQVSGIWQTVWLEQVPVQSIAELDISTDAGKGAITVAAEASKGAKSERIRVKVLDGEKTVAQAEGAIGGTTIVVPNAKLWSPGSPHLYGLEISLLSSDGRLLDTVDSYAGIRTVGKTRDEAGNLRFTLNGETIFHWGPLDQGWWPDGLLTPPSDEAMLFDIEYLKAAGFNMIRKHIKVEPRRYYYHCDRLGMLVWQDQVSGGPSPPWTRMDLNPKDADWPADQHEQFMREFEWMVDDLENHPSIVVWTPFNEAWGQHQTVEVGEWTIKRDPSRHVNIASGGNFWPVGDVADEHAYPNPNFPIKDDRYNDYIKVVGEFGGHGYAVEGHLWDSSRDNWGYGGLPKNKAEYKQRYVKSLEILNDLRHQGIAAGVYTQTTDVEGEINGLMTYDRKEIKIPAEELAELHQQLFEPLKSAK